MNKLTIAFLSVVLLLSPAYAKEKAHTIPLSAGIQQAQAATLEDSEDEKPKTKKKATKKVKKSKKMKRT